MFEAFLLVGLPFDSPLNEKAKKHGEGTGFPTILYKYPESEKFSFIFATFMVDQRLESRKILCTTFHRSVST